MGNKPEETRDARQKREAMEAIIAKEGSVEDGKRPWGTPGGV